MIGGGAILGEMVCQKKYDPVSATFRSRRYRELIPQTIYRLFHLESLPLYAYLVLCQITDTLGLHERKLLVEKTEELNTIKPITRLAILRA
jgi:hypothetical protein